MVSHMTLNLMCSTTCTLFEILCKDGLMMVWWLKLVANKVNEILLCLTETNKFIVVFQFYNTMRCPLQKFPHVCLFSSHLSIEEKLFWPGIRCWGKCFRYIWYASCCSAKQKMHFGHKWISVSSHFTSPTLAMELTNWCDLATSRLHAALFH
jgi:hypothetical protein